MHYTDAHTHLNSDELYLEREQHLSGFISVGGTGLVNVGVDPVWNRRSVEIAQKALGLYKDRCTVKATIGGHPSEVSFGKVYDTDSIDSYIRGLETLFLSAKDYIVAIGECGIDAHYPGFTDELAVLQQDFFRKQCLLARVYALPIVIHSRDRFDLMFDVLQEFSDLSIYLHCRGYGPNEIQKMIATFPHIRFGFCGNLSYPKATALRESFLSIIQHERYAQCTVGLLIETDAPRLSPQGRRGQRHAPMYIVDQYSYAAELAGIEQTVFIDRVGADRRRLYNI